MFRFRKQRLPLPALALLLFIGVMGAALVWQLIVFLQEPDGPDWLLAAVFVVTILLFVVMGLAVFLLDFEQKLVLLREGIYIMPTIFAAYQLNWDDIEKLELSEGRGFRLIEYRLKPGSPSYQTLLKREGLRRFLATEGRNGGFHGAIPLQAYPLKVEAADEQNNVRANRLFAVLYRFWKNPLARTELPDSC